MAASAGEPPPPAGIADQRVPLRFAVLAFRPRPETTQRWQPVVDYLAEKIPGRRIVFEPLTYPELEQAVRERKVDLVLTQPAHYVALSTAYDLYSPLATLVELEQNRPLTQFGGVIVVKAGEQKIRTLEDLRNKRIATSAQGSLGAFLAQAYELLQRGVRTSDLQITETGEQDAAVAKLAAGEADAAFVRSGLLEQMAHEGKINLAEFSVLKADNVPDYPLLLSTRLYPQWALAAMPWLEEGTARQIAGAVLSLPHDGEIARAAHISGFTVPGDYRSVDRLMRTLRVPPFDKRVSLLTVWEDHQTFVIALMAGLLLVSAWGARAYLLNRRQRILAAEQLRRAASVFSHASEGIVITDPTGSIIEVNDAFTRITGYSKEEVLGKNPRILSSGRQTAEFYEGMWQALTRVGEWSGEIWNRRRNGELYVELLTITSIRNDHQVVQQYIGLFHDITEQKEHQHELEVMAHYDALTGMPNRLLLADRMTQAMASADRRENNVAVIYADLDGFKSINDRYGHMVGDQLLAIMAQRMKSALREGDTLSRLGGDEFVAVLLDLETHDAAIPVLDRLLRLVASPVQVDDVGLHLTTSIGVSFYPQAEAVDADQVLRQADQAMYQAKRAGKNRYQLFDAEGDRVLRGRHESISRIRQALEDGEFVLYYQPKLNMRTGTVVGMEALIRWRHPEKGILAPAVFLPLINDHELIEALGDWVIENALIQMSVWRHSGIELPVSVNVAARQMQAPEFIDKLKMALKRHPDVAHQLELEVLETGALEDMTRMSKLIRACKQMGVAFALDDFGTGYSSLSYLKRLPVETLKIDQAFVRNMLEDPEDLAILDGIIGLAESFERKVVAEGVETWAHGEMLLRMGCELAQGYAIAPPMPSNDVLDWLRSSEKHRTPIDLPRVGRDQLELLFAITEVRALVKWVDRYLKGKGDSPPPLDSIHCRLGKWLARAGTDQRDPTLERLAAVHEAMHRRAAALCEPGAYGSRIWSHGGKEEIERMSNEVIARLTELLGADHGKRHRTHGRDSTRVMTRE